MNQIIVNRIQTPDGTILHSKHTHDYQSHEDANGELYFIDGGNSYLRCSVNKEDAKDLSYYLSDINDIEKWKEIRQLITRGTFDKNGKRIFIPIADMSKEHLANCIVYNIYQNGIDVDCTPNILYMHELWYRKITEK